MGRVSGIVRAGAALVVAFSASALVARCVAVASSDEHGSAGPDGARPGPPASLEQLAAKMGCQPKIQVEAAELRQGYCTTTTGRYFLTTFTTAQGQRAWLEQAQDYGALLVGNRWIASASPQVLAKLRGTLGGDLYDLKHAGSGHAHQG